MAGRHISTVALALAAFVGAVIAAGAAMAAPQLVSKHGDWAAYLNEENGKKLCFVISQPQASEMNPAGRKRGPGFVFVSYRPSENISGEISIAFGYPLAAGTTRAVIGDTAFSLYAKDESAWIENASDEPKLIEAMKAGSAMKVYGKSARGTATIDTYSLSGVTAAIGAASKACGN
ncbi:MAG: hypothetical protein KDJ77_16055 [Rhodobiaceae bacterium]|nr:hypothetical protein [Rhodobiaceae bacterium]